MTDIERRKVCQQLLGMAGLSAQTTLSIGNTTKSIEPTQLRKLLPGKTQTISAIGMGTWITFDVPDIISVRRQRTKVLQTFFDLGGQMIDSSPMYGLSEDMLGHALERIDAHEQLFAASKIWTPFAADGRAQMSQTERLWNAGNMDLMYVHNLLGVNKHLPKLREWKNEGRIRYIGVSTSHGRRHDELESLMKREPLDFIQLTLNIDQTQVEKRLLPLAADRGIAVVVNRPFGRGALISKYSSRPLPGVAIDLGCQNWPQFLLLYTISNPAVTCAIPATSKVEHMRENMGTLQLAMPDERTRLAMRAAVA